MEICYLEVGLACFLLGSRMFAANSVSFQWSWSISPQHCSPGALFILSADEGLLRREGRVPAGRARGLVTPLPLCHPGPRLLQHASPLRRCLDSHVSQIRFVNITFLPTSVIILSINLSPSKPLCSSSLSSSWLTFSL